MNKGINAIAYNVLGKPQQITFSDGRTVNYTYDAGGNKLATTTTVGGTTTTTDYTSGFVYNTVSGTRTLAFISSPEGRAVKNSSGYEYQYAIADHQGNTRILFTSAAPVVDTKTATFETTNQANEQNYFSNYTTNSAYIDSNPSNANSGSNSLKLNGGYAGVVGVAKSYKVYPGDKVHIDGFAKVGTTCSSCGPSGLANFASILFSAFNVAPPGAGEIGTASAGLNSWAGINTTWGFGDGSTDNTDPKVFVNIIIFDKNYNFLDVAYSQLTSSGSMSADYTAKEEGFAYMYVSNEIGSPTWVYFDDVTMRYTPTSILQNSDYYAFGLQHSTSWTRDNTTNNFLYDAGSELNSTTGMYDLPNRNYDAALGRFFQVDPLSHATHDLTPYHYAANNPIGNNDPSGLMHVSDANVYNPGGGGGGHNGFDEAVDVIDNWNRQFKAWAEDYYANRDGSTTNSYGKDGNLEGTLYVGRDARRAFAAMQQEYLGAVVALRTFTLNLQMQNAYYYAVKEGRSPVKKQAGVALASSDLKDLSWTNGLTQSKTGWMARAIMYAGLKEYVPGNTSAKNFIDDATILSMLCDVGVNTDGHHSNESEMAWCAAFVNRCLDEEGIVGTGSAWAGDFNGYGTKLDAPVWGAIAVQDGHVGFFAGYTDDTKTAFWMLGGNQGNPGQVNLSWMSVSSVVYWGMPQAPPPPNYDRDN